MATKRRLERRIGSTEDMGTIVRTMKALAAVNVRLFESARDSIDSYFDTVERAIQVVLRDPAAQSQPISELSRGTRRRDGPIGLFVYGSVQGMCGQFNEHVAAHAARIAERADAPVQVVAIGARIASRLGGLGLRVGEELPLSGRVSGLPAIVDRCVLQTEALRREGAGSVRLCYNRPTGRPAYEPGDELVLPLGDRWLRAIGGRPWPTRQQPSALTPLPQLFGSLLRQYLFAAFYRAAARSLAAENAARLAAMQSAEKNIDERLSELRATYNRLRQTEITEELLDIVGGYTALEESRH